VFTRVQQLVAGSEAATDAPAAPADTTTAAGTDTAPADTATAAGSETAPAATTAAGTESATSDSTTADSAPQDKTTTMLGGGLEKIKLTPEEQKFVDLVNKERKDRNIPVLTVAPLLVQTARAKSKEMYDLNYWGHETPGKKQSTAMYRVLAVLKEQPKYMMVGENLYYCSQTLVESGHQALMNSPTHRRNILNLDYNYIGVGAYIAKDGRFWVTEHFLKITY